MPLAIDRTVSGAIAGPIVVTAHQDFQIWGRYFRMEVLPFSPHTIKSVAFNVAPADLAVAGNPGFFNIGVAKGVTPGNVT